MKFFYDTEFLEGPQTKRFLGIPIGKTKPTIDLISIAIVAEDGREYYAICSDFNVDEAWGRYEVIPANTAKNHSYFDLKEYWIRENVLYPIYQELASVKSPFSAEGFWSLENPEIDYNSRWELRRLVETFGKSRGQIALEVWEFICEGQAHEAVQGVNRSAELYGYYADHDHVALSWLFGRMINLPKELPMYTRDLKQMLDEKAASFDWYHGRDIWSNTRQPGDLALQEGDYHATLEEKLGKIKKQPLFPKQTNEHNALADARWNKQLYEFIQTL